MNDAVVPDGEGGFIIRDDAELSDDGEFIPPSLPENGFIDFHNQFKVVIATDNITFARTRQQV